MAAFVPGDDDRATQSNLPDEAEARAALVLGLRQRGIASVNILSAIERLPRRLFSRGPLSQSGLRRHRASNGVRADHDRAGRGCVCAPASRLAARSNGFGSWDGFRVPDCNPLTARPACLQPRPISDPSQAGGSTPGGLETDQRCA
jgi:hypothetical protein